ncbi:hypothetical protein ANO14919_100760 [Xylariales sp. No.14919]|nr:hypothetical protein ANO14919_100760 [Xylariales sp. No.14919]
MQAPRRQRRRLPRSCEECRRRKVKCDRNHPCSHCVLTKCRCLYNVGQRPLAGHPERLGRGGSFYDNRLPAERSVDTTLDFNLAPRQRLSFDSSSSVFGSAGAESHAVSHPTSHPAGFPGTNDFEAAGFTGRARSPKGATPQSKSSSTLEASRAPAPLTPSYGHGDTAALVLNKSRLFGRTHWTNAVHEFKKIASFTRSEARNTAEQVAGPPLKTAIRTLMQQCKQLSRNAKTPRPGRLLSCPEPIVSSLETADHLVHLYESNFEDAFRILHKPSFRREYERYKTAPADVADVTILKIQLVIAIGCGLCPELGDAREVYGSARRWLYAAQDWLSAPVEKNRLSLAAIQVHCLLILARQVLSVGGDLSWVAIGTLLRSAVQMGLHRDPKHFPQMSVFQAEMRKRLWATILELNAQASLDSGMPPGISYDDFDTGPPANINDEDIDETTTPATPHNEAAATDASLQRFLLQNLPPRLEMLRRLNGPGSALNDETMSTLSAKLSSACREASSSTLAPTSPPASSRGFRQNMASLLLRRFLLILHRPLAGRIHENALYYRSRKVSFDSAMALLRPPSPSDAAFAHLMRRGGGLFKSCLNHVSLALASELLIEIEEQGPSLYREMLVDAVAEARQRWVERLELGDTNVMLHMKLSIVLSQAGAGAGGEDGGASAALLQQRMAQSAKDSLEMCYGLIKANLGADDTAALSEADGGRGGLRLVHGDESLGLLSGDPFSFADILHIGGSDADGMFDPNILLL